MPHDLRHDIVRGMPHDALSPVAVPGAATAATDQTTYLGRASVLGISGQQLRVALATEPPLEVLVTPALTFPYQATAGDTLLVLGQGAAHYAVGVIAAARQPTLEFRGDASIRAVGGRLLLSSDQAVELHAPRVTVRAGLLRTLAGTVVEKADQVRRWVRGLLAVRAGESRRLIDGLDSTRCENSTTLAKDTVKIDGDQLHLGH